MKTSALIMAFATMTALSACSSGGEFGRGKVVAFLEAQGYEVVAVSHLETKRQGGFCPGTWSYYPFVTTLGNGFACINEETGEVSLNTLQPATTPSTVTPLPTED